MQRFELKKKRRSQEAGSSEDDDPDRDYLDKLDNGLYTLQRLTLILADVAICVETARLREEKLFQMKMSNNRLDLMLGPVGLCKKHLKNIKNSFWLIIFSKKIVFFLSEIEEILWNWLSSYWKMKFKKKRNCFLIKWNSYQYCFQLFFYLISWTFLKITNFNWNQNIDKSN